MASNSALMWAVLSVTLIPIPSQLHAAQAIALCLDMRKFGVGNGDSMQEAGLNAKQNCVYNGGTSSCCHLLTVTEIECTAVALNDDGAPFVAGGASRDEAIGKAYRLCQAEKKPGCKVMVATRNCGR